MEVVATRFRYIGFSFNNHFKESIKRGTLCISVATSSQSGYDKQDKIFSAIDDWPYSNWLSLLCIFLSPVFYFLSFP